jgi:CTP synthase
MRLINDFNTSVEKAFEEINPNWKKLDGIVVCGTHSPKKKDMEKILEEIHLARITGVPFMGICAGMQFMVIEYARNFLGIKGATTQELEPKSPNAVIVKMPELRVGIRSVGGALESHWHHYKVEESIIPQLKDVFETVSTDGILEIMKHRNHRHFMGVQFHPEYQSSRENPHRLFTHFLNVCRK